MARKRITAGALLPVLAAAAFGVLQWSRAGTLTAEAAAEVLDAHSSYHAGPQIQTPHFTTSVHFRYTVAGQIYERTQTEDGDFAHSFAPDKAAKACYDPAEPQVAEIVPARRTCPPRYRPWDERVWEPGLR
ncbi:MAG TPA: hypothetical protein VFL91_22400 [Thermomicrobiales bacterium]|nr:hypothetical protein [Thermomicrobiales bacterium]